MTGKSKTVNMIPLGPKSLDSERSPTNIHTEDVKTHNPLTALP